MNLRPKLCLDWCSHEAARYACEKWHYSKCVPAGKLAKIGVWEEGVFVGAVIFSRGANSRIGSPFSLPQVEVCELTRVALSRHQTPVSRIVSIAIRLLRKENPGLRLIVSYADPQRGHKGGIYQAMNWPYIGRSRAQRGLLINGKRVHKRTASSLYGTASPKAIESKTGKSAEYDELQWKHTYALPLDREVKTKIEAMRRTYPNAPEA